MPYLFTRILEQPSIMYRCSMSEATSYKKRIYENDEGFQELVGDILSGKITQDELSQAIMHYRDKLYSHPKNCNVYIEEQPMVGLYLIAMYACHAGLDFTKQLREVLETMRDFDRTTPWRDFGMRNIYNNFVEVCTKGKELNESPEQILERLLLDEFGPTTGVILGKEDCVTGG